MISKTAKRFRMCLSRLPADVRRQAREAYRVFRENPSHPGLRFKKVHTTQPIYSVRINIEYRALGILDRSEIVWFWIGPHAEYEQLLERL